jgi:hypothetical protein
LEREDELRLRGSPCQPFLIRGRLPDHVEIEWLWICCICGVKPWRLAAIESPPWPGIYMAKIALRAVRMMSCCRVLFFLPKRADVKRLEVLGIEGSAASMSSQRLMLSGEKASSGGQKGAGKLLALSKRQAIKLRERRTHTASDPSSTLQHRYTNNTRIYLTNRIYLDPRKLQIPPIPHAQKRSNTHQDAGPSDVCQ